MAAAVGNAVNNSLRKKGKRPIPLWKKKRKQLDTNQAKENLALILDVERKEGKSWIDYVYKMNGRKRKGGE